MPTARVSLDSSLSKNNQPALVNCFVYKDWYVGRPRQACIACLGPACSSCSVWCVCMQVYARMVLHHRFTSIYTLACAQHSNSSIQKIIVALLFVTYPYRHDLDLFLHSHCSPIPIIPSPQTFAWRNAW